MLEPVCVPWEDMARIGFWRALLDTVAGVLLTPSRLFGLIEPQKNVRNALYFGVLTGSFGYIFGGLWKIFLNGRAAQLESVPLPAFFSQTMQTATVFFAPILALLALLLGGIGIHSFLMLARGNRKGFRATLQVMSYANAAYIFAMVPYIGAFVSAIWGLVAVVIGLRQVHGISTARAVIAVFLPFFALLFIAALVVVLVLLLIPSLFHEFGRQVLPFLNSF